MPNKKFKVVGIGNAIVDLLGHVDDAFITEFGLEKGITRLIDEAEATKLYNAMTVEEEVSGGSIANSIAGLASLGNSVAFIGKVKNDPFGNSFEKGLMSCGVSSSVKKVDDGVSTARCVVLVTPDAQRTMNTYLGISDSLGPDDLDESALTDTAITYLEGYLMYQAEARKAIVRATEITKRSGGKVALSLSDPFCVENNKSSFMDLVKNHIDLLFANEDEIISLLKADSIESAMEICRDIGIVCAVTRGSKGSVIVSKNETYIIDAEPISKLIDTTGAGDMYAAGFLHGYTNNCDLKNCGKMGSIAAAEIVTHFGARPKTPLAELMKM